MSSTPSIRIHRDSRRQPTSYPSSFSSPALPMAIPRAREPVPPPLPPPTFIPEISQGRDPGWQWGNDPNGSDFGRPASVKPGSSLLRGTVRSTRQEEDQSMSASHHFDAARRGSSISTITMGRERDSTDDGQHYSDEDMTSPRPTSKGYVPFYLTCGC
jgi:hypothetical protein